MTARNTPKRDVTIPLCGKEDPIDGMLYPFADEVWSFMSYFTPRVPEWDDPVFEIHVPAPLLPGRLFPACRARSACRACALANGTEVPGGDAQEHWRCRQSATAPQPPPQSSADPRLNPASIAVAPPCSCHTTVYHFTIPSPCSSSPGVLFCPQSLTVVHFSHARLSTGHRDRPLVLKRVSIS
jgi:hypothetical protein